MQLFMSHLFMKKVQHSASLFFHTQTSLFRLNNKHGMYFQSNHKTVFFFTISLLAWSSPSQQVSFCISRGFKLHPTLHKGLRWALKQTMAAKDQRWLCGDGKALDVEELKKEVQCCSKLLSSSESEESLQGGKRFYDLIMAAWSLDTSLAVDAAELVCDAIR